MHDKSPFVYDSMRPSMTKQDLNDGVATFIKVWGKRNELL